jgi:hypothetical protein
LPSLPTHPSPLAPKSLTNPEPLSPKLFFPILSFSFFLTSLLSQIQPLSPEIFLGDGHLGLQCPDHDCIRGHWTRTLLHSQDPVSFLSPLPAVE